MEALAVTAQLCGPELERYGRCVAASPGSWHRDCHQLSLSVTECASNHAFPVFPRCFPDVLPLPRSPLVRRIRRDCSDSFGAFERCLRERPRSAAECGPHVSQFLLCAQNVTQRDTPSATSSASPGGTPSATPSATSTENPWN
ncbi:coiled-coil-helix-coiled-coil-helix domain-containing protein 5 isoform X4 [Haemorhous mexicanus]|uniref:coiled-coil-helix-coiled-coil-helix domain-containing protein 5 isoform X4 n=1 Tax=Haemorhous mexicanus TaxID=30427 RepID=UPI0028BEC3ED|nr:coiled-coil-helix-coiled-coil-helix domain-containing protein 5 isoform X4 [Haemorhous mexicanus]